MITIDCKDMEDLLLEAAVYLADNIGAVPAIKTGCIALDPLTDSELNTNNVKTHLERFLTERGIIQHFIIKVGGEMIKITAISERKIQENNIQSPFLMCPYCGFVTSYEEELDVHMKADLSGGIF